MKKKTKTVTMVVTVRLPADFTAAEARREVRTLVNDQCNYRAEYNDVHVVSVKAGGKA